jgi:transposase-like protein
MDGTFLNGHKGIFVVMDALSHQVLYGEYNIAESPKDLYPFFERVQALGLCPHAVTTDGNPALLKLLHHFWPSAILQRCIVHVQRQGLMWCRENPKTPEARQLRQLFLRLTNIHTVAQRIHFSNDWKRWEKRYGKAIDKQPYKGWVFSDLKKARKMLVNALPHLFHYLEDPLIAYSTNALEGYFSRLKNKYHQHRGLYKIHRAHYFKWYFYWVNK